MSLSLIDALRRLRESVKAPPITSRPSPSGVQIQLPPPPSIEDKLLSTQLSFEATEQLLTIYSKKCQELRRAAETNWSSLSASLGAIPKHGDHNVPAVSNTCEEMFQNRYLRSVKDLAERILRQADDMRAEELKTDELNTRATRFQPSFKPLLERYFKNDPFPAREDKECLARQTGMDYRQIHTWFQNRRARARREGEPMKYKITNRSSHTAYDYLGNETIEHRNSNRCGTLPDGSGPLSSTGEETIDFVPPTTKSSALDSQSIDGIDPIIPRHHPHVFSCTPLCSLEAKRSSVPGFSRRQRALPRPHSQLDMISKAELLRQCLIINVEEDQEMESAPRHRIYEFGLRDRHGSELNANDFRRPGSLASYDNLASTHPIYTSSKSASRSFSDAFESQYPATLGSPNIDVLTRPTKKRRATDTIPESHSSLMSLAEVCSATSPLEPRKFAAFPKRVPSAVNNYLPSAPTSPLSSAASPLSSIESLATTSPPSSPLSRATSFGSDLSDHLFSDFSDASMSVASTPPSPAIMLPILHPSPSADLPSPSLSTSSDELFGIDPHGCSQISSKCSASRPAVSLQVSQVVRQVAICSRPFASSAANSMLRLDF